MNSVNAYEQNGFELFSLDMKREIIGVREKIFSLFDLIAIEHGVGRVQSDEELIKLYEGPNIDLWRAIYDHLPDIPQIASLAFHPPIIEIARKCGIREPASTNGKPVILINMPGQNSRAFPPHQDLPYDPGGSENSLVIWIPLQDITDELGPVEVIPKSHKLGLLLHEDNVDVKKANTKIPEGLEPFQPVNAQVGQALVLSNFSVHKSGLNLSKQKVKMSLHFRFRDLASPEYLNRKLSKKPVLFNDGLKFSINS